MLFYSISSHIRLEGSDPLSTLLPTAATIVRPLCPTEKHGRARFTGRPLTKPRLECGEVDLLCVAQEVVEEHSAHSTACGSLLTTIYI